MLSVQPIAPTCPQGRHLFDCIVSSTPHVLQALLGHPHPESRGYSRRPEETEYDYKIDYNAAKLILETMQVCYCGVEADDVVLKLSVGQSCEGTEIVHLGVVPVKLCEVVLIAFDLMP